MAKLLNCKNRIIKMMEPYPIYDEGEPDKILGYTAIGDLAIITYSDLIGNYHETVIVSGKYIGIDTLVLDNDDLKKAVFIINHNDDQFKFIKNFYIESDEVKMEIV